MRKTTLLLSICALTVALESCKKDSPEPEPKFEEKEVYVDASSKTEWHYISFAQGAVVGSAAESAESSTAWGARKDWDIAVRRYNIRTNSGEFTTVGAQGGVYTSDAATTFASLLKLPADATFATDRAITSSGMGGVTTVVRSEATVVKFKTNEDGSLVMPPVYLAAPIYVFRSADGAKYYKVEFTQYVNENSVAGHVKFKFVELGK